MNKTWIFIGGMACIMVGVMVFLTIKGVSHREHTFIKWSAVAAPEEMGIVSMRRMFPVLEGLQTLSLVGAPDVAQPFSVGFDKGLKDQNLPVAIAHPEASDPNPDNLVIQMVPLKVEEAPGSCSDVSKDQCLYFKALRGWQKKKRDGSKYWFLLQWVANNNFKLFYVQP